MSKKLSTEKLARKRECYSRSYFLGEKCTNNEAEYYALVLGLEMALKLNVRELVVEGDSELRGILN